jgi:hypothetical protein
MVVFVDTWFCWFVLSILLSCLRMSLSHRPPLKFFSSQSLFFVGFLTESLKTVYLTSGKDGKRLQKVGKGGKRWKFTLPVSENMWIHAKLLSENRFQTPVLVRWKFKLEPGEVLKVKVSPMRSHASETFFARLQKEGRITVPARVAVFLELKLGDVLEVGLLAEKSAEK